MNPIQNRKSEIRNVLVGTRGSALAQWQTDFVIAALKRLASDLSIERRVIKTSGDKDQTRPLAEFGGLGVFTKEIESALLAHEIDLAVHSLKDLPTDMSAGLTIAAIMEREDARDCLVSRHHLGLMELPHGARVGTSSARRTAQLLALRPDLKIVPLRGNVDTRMRKAQTEDYEAILIAAAGLIRLGHASEISEYLPLESMLPDPGQGALAVQIRAEDQTLAALISRLDHAPSRAAVTAERAFLRGLGGGCRTPIGAHALVGAKDSTIHLRGMVASLDGTKIVRGELRGDTAHAEKLGTHLAEQILYEGASGILGIDGGPRHSPSRIGRPATPANSETNTGPESGRSALPLRGRRILITRAREQASVLADKIRALGGEPVEFPAIDIAPLEDFRELDAALGRAAEFDWIIFTSANGVRAVEERLNTLGLRAEILANAKLAAIGPATTSTLKQAGLVADFVPTKFLGEQIAIELPVEIGQRALLLRADLASERLAQGLAARGVLVTDVDAYRTIMPPSRSLDLKQVDAAMFTSSSTVRNLLAMLNGGGLDALNDLAVFCIGPVTADTARELGLHVDAVAVEHTVDGLVSAMVDYYRRTEGGSQLLHHK